jgi:hypothetical protein
MEWQKLIVKGYFIYIYIYIFFFFVGLGRPPSGLGRPKFFLPLQHSLATKIYIFITFLEYLKAVHDPFKANPEKNRIVGD